MGVVFMAMSVIVCVTAVGEPKYWRMAFGFAGAVLALGVVCVYAAMRERIALARANGESTLEIWRAARSGGVLLLLGTFAGTVLALSSEKPKEWHVGVGAGIASAGMVRIMGAFVRRKH
jgi:hypothetical protein